MVQKLVLPPKKRTNQSVSMLYDLGRLYFYNVDFERSHRYLHQALSQIQLPENEIIWQEIVVFIMRINLDRWQLDEAYRHLEFCLKQIENHSSYRLSVTGLFLNGLYQLSLSQWEKAEAYFQEAYRLSSQKKDRYLMLESVYGLTYSLLEQKNTSMCLLLLKKADKISHFFKNHELYIQLQNIKAMVYLKNNRNDMALSLFNKSLKWSQKYHHWHQYLEVSYLISKAYRYQGSQTRALHALKQNVELSQATQFERIKKMVLKDLTYIENHDYDLVVNIPERLIIKRNHGTINLRNQFVVIELLTLLVKNQGRLFSKEELTKAIWHQNYHPAYHDNKIYYNISRLRSILEDREKTGLIVTTKEGYVLDADLRIELIEHAQR